MVELAPEVQLLVYRWKSRGERMQRGGSGAGDEVSPAPCAPAVRKEVSDPPAGGVRYARQVELESVNRMLPSVL